MPDQQRTCWCAATACIGGLQTLTESYYRIIDGVLLGSHDRLKTNSSNHAPPTRSLNTMSQRPKTNPNYEVWRCFRCIGHSVTWHNYYWRHKIGAHNGQCSSDVLATHVRRASSIWLVTQSWNVHFSTQHIVRGYYAQPDNIILYSSDVYYKHYSVPTNKTDGVWMTTAFIGLVLIVVHANVRT